MYKKLQVKQLQAVCWENSEIIQRQDQNFWHLWNDDKTLKIKIWNLHQLKKFISVESFEENLFTTMVYDTKKNWSIIYFNYLLIEISNILSTHPGLFLANSCHFGSCIKVAKLSFKKRNVSSFIKYCPLLIKHNPVNVSKIFSWWTDDPICFPHKSVIAPFVSYLSENIWGIHLKCIY